MNRAALFTILLSLSAPSLAGISPVQTKGNAGAAGSWLSDYSASARSLAMGTAGAALTGAEAAYLNPAGIARLEAAEASVLISPLLEDGQFQALSVAYPFQNRARGVGLSIYHMSSGDAEQTNALGESVGTFNDQNLAGVVTYSGRVWRDWLAMGTNFKYVRQSLAGKAAAGFGLDAGFQARVIGEKLRIGAAMMNLLAPSLTLDEKKESHPALLRTGLSTEWSLFKTTVLFAADLILSEDAGGNKTNKMAFGFEVEPLADSAFPILIRAGYNQRSVTMGLGLMKAPVSLEYAATFHELDLTHQFGVKFKFGLMSPMAEAKLQSEWLSLADREKAIKRKLAQKEETLRRLRRELRRGRQVDSADVAPEPGDAALETTAAKYQKALHQYNEKHYKEAKETLAKDRIPGLAPDHRLLSLENLIDARVLIQQDMYSKAREKLFDAVQYDPLNEEAAEVYRKVKEIIEINETLETKK